MAVTRLVRKAKKNRTVSKKRVKNIKRLTSTPVIKNVDIEQIKEEFAKKKAQPVAKKESVKAEVAETPQAEVKAEKPAKEAAPKAKAVKKAAPKKAKKDDKSAE